MLQNDLTDNYLFFSSVPETFGLQKQTGLPYSSRSEQPPPLSMTKLGSFLERKGLEGSYPYYGQKSTQELLLYSKNLTLKF